LEASQLVLPALATVALGTALLVPLRDDRRGRRATASGFLPLRADFRALTPVQDGGSPEQSVGNDDLHRTIVVVGTDAADAALDATPTTATSSNAATQGDSQESAVDDIIEPPKCDVVIASEQPVPLNVRAVKTTEAALHRIAESWRSLFHTAHAPTTMLSAAADTVVERSFAAELDALLGSCEAAEGFERPRPPHDERSQRTTARLTGQQNAEVFSAAPQATTRSEFVVEGELPGTAPVPRERAAEGVVVRAKQMPPERIVPLTRLPLRPMADEVTWCCSFAIESRDERHALLACLRHEESGAQLKAGRAVDVLTQAYREEDAEGRVLVLHALARRFPRDAVDTFIDALKVGTDEERAVAVDALAAAHRPDALVAAFSDRVDAIAARAAFAYVGSNVRADYVAALGPNVDAPRLAAILALLAGFIE